jgi:hypothetical protein
MILFKKHDKDTRFIIHVIEIQIQIENTNLY